MALLTSLLMFNNCKGLGCDSIIRLRPLRSCHARQSMILQVTVAYVYLCRIVRLCYGICNVMSIQLIVFFRDWFYLLAYE